MSVSIYWFLVGKPLAIKASAQIITELELQSPVVFENKSNFIWRPIARLIKKRVEEKYQSEVLLSKHIKAGNIYYVFSIANQSQIYILPLNHLDFYSPQAMLASILLVLALSLITAWLIARKISVPIQKINVQIKNIGSTQQPKAPAYCDIVELDELIKQVHWMQSRINQLLHNNLLNYAAFSHDLKTPITQIGIALELIKADVSEQKYRQIKNSLQQLNQRINGFIKQSKSGIQEQEKNISLSDFLCQFVNDFKQNYENRRLKLTINKTTSNNCDIYVNRLYRILENLLKNALMHTNSDIEISLHQDNYRTKISISDWGSIAEASIAKLNNSYEDFWQKLDPMNAHSIGILTCHQLAFQSNWKVLFKKNSPKGLVAQLIIH